MPELEAETNLATRVHALRVVRTKMRDLKELEAVLKADVLALIDTDDDVTVMHEGRAVLSVKHVRGTRLDTKAVKAIVDPDVLLSCMVETSSTRVELID